MLAATAAPPLCLLARHNPEGNSLRVSFLPPTMKLALFALLALSTVACCLAQPVYSDGTSRMSMQEARDYQDFVRDLQQHSMDGPTARFQKRVEGQRGAADCRAPSWLPPPHVLGFGFELDSAC